MVDQPDERSTSHARLAALVEVALVFALAHTAFRAFRRFTELGREEVAEGLMISPGLVFAGFGLACIAARRLGWRESGLTWRGGVSAVAVGLAFLFATCAAGGALHLAGIRHTGFPIPPVEGAVFALTSVLVTAGTLLVLRRRDAWLRSLRPVWVLGVACSILVLPIGVASARGTMSAALVAAVAWRFVCAGIGEELFFRGYVQSRLNAVFGRPWSWLGVRFGVGLVVASLLFGLVHLLNPFDTFSGAGRFAWWHALLTTLAPYGFLREKTGSVVAPATLHGLLDVTMLLTVATR